MNLSLNDTEKMYLRNLAATQFPHCVDKYGTRGSLLHVILDVTKTPEKVDLDMCYDFDDIDVWVYGDSTDEGWYDEETCYTGKTLFELLCEMLDATCRLTDECKEQLKSRCEKIDSDIDEVYNLLSEYNYDSEYLFAYRMVASDNPDVRGFALTHNAAERLALDIDNHIFGQKRFYATVPDSFHDDAGDFSVLVGLLKRLGDDLLAQDHKHIHITVPSVSEDEVIASCKKASNTGEEYRLLATVSIDETAEDDLHQYAGQTFTIGVSITGITIKEIPYYVGNTSSDENVRVEGDYTCWMMDTNGKTNRTCRYPFACNQHLEALIGPQNEGNWFRLFDYLRFSGK